MIISWAMNIRIIRSSMRWIDNLNIFNLVYYMSKSELVWYPEELNYNGIIVDGLFSILNAIIVIVHMMLSLEFIVRDSGYSRHWG